MAPELHCALLGEVHTSSYFHALLVHGLAQHEILCCRSANENEERIFKRAESAAKCTDSRKCCLTLMPPYVLKMEQTSRIFVARVICRSPLFLVSKESLKSVAF